MGDTIWCYTTNPNKRWDYCNQINETNAEGLWGRNGSKYRGNLNVTRTGK